MSPSKHTDARPIIELPSEALTLLALLERAGWETWLVGGFVRDALLGQGGHDIDFATQAPWPIVKELVCSHGFSCHETGVKFGTVTVVIGETSFEVTTYRSERGYDDKRHPDEVSFESEISTDLARRDFTINAIAYHPERGLFDPYDGVEDLKRRLIRAVGDPRRRFAEDALRILRAVRFSSQLGFAIEAGSFEAMVELKSGLNAVAAERIAHEMDRLLCGRWVRHSLISCLPVLIEPLPELAPMESFNQRSPYHIYDAWEHTAFVVEGVQPTPVSRWAALLHDIGKPPTFHQDENGRGHFPGHPRLSVTMAQEILTRLHYPRRPSEDILTLIRLHDAVIEPTVPSVTRALRKLGGRVDLFLALCDLKAADARAQTPGISSHLETALQLPAVLDEIEAREIPFSVHDLAINGRDLMELGIEPGPAIGKALSTCLDAVESGTVANEHDALIAFMSAHRA